MTGLIAGLLATAAAVTWAFLRPRTTVKATPFPSLQHLQDDGQPRRRWLHLEDLLGWAARLVAVSCFVMGIAVERLELGHPLLEPVVLVDPATGAAGWQAAKQVDAKARLGFSGELPRVEGPLGSWLEPTVRDCSASTQRCLARAAARSGRPVLLVGAEAHGWDGAELLVQPVRWTAAAREPTTPPPIVLEPEPAPPDITRLGTSGEAWLWAAALEDAARTLRVGAKLVVLDAEASAPPVEQPTLVVIRRPHPALDWVPEVRAEPLEAVRLDPAVAGVGAATLAASLEFAARAGTRPLVGRLVVAREGSPAPAVTVAATEEELGRWAHEGQLPALARVVLAELTTQPLEVTLEGGARGPGCALDGGPAPLRVRTTELLELAMTSGRPGAGSASDGDRSHTENIGATRAAGGRGTGSAADGGRALAEPVEAPTAPSERGTGSPADRGPNLSEPLEATRAAGARGNASADGGGRALRGAVTLPLAGAMMAGAPGTLGERAAEPQAPSPGLPGAWRAADGGPAPLGVLDVAPGTYLRADGRLRVHVRRAPEVPEMVSTEARSPSDSLPLATLLLAAAVVVFLFALFRKVTVLSGALGALALVALVACALDLERQASRTPLRVLRLTSPDLGVEETLRDAGLEVATAPERLACELPRQTDPCVVLGTLGPAASPGPHPTALLFDTSRARVDVLEVRAPGKVPLGNAASVEVLLRARRGREHTLIVTARPSHGATVERRVVLHSDDQVVKLGLPVVPLLEGEDTVAIEAHLDDAQDGAAVKLAVDGRLRRRVLLAGMPSWEARFARRALETHAGGTCASLTRLGATAVLAVGLEKADPVRWLGTPGALTDVDTLVLTGFEATAFTPAAAKGLEAFVERGGALLFLGADGVQAIGWQPIEARGGPPSALQGELGDEAEQLPVTLPLPGPMAGPLGNEVLAWLRDGARREPWLVGRGAGAGRVAVIRTTDLFRLSPPAGGGAEAERVLFHALAWAEAGPGSRPGSAGEAERVPAQSPARARLRDEASFSGQPFPELDGQGALAAVAQALPVPEERPFPVPVRREPAMSWLTLALVGLESLSRRWTSRRRSAGTHPSS